MGEHKAIFVRHEFGKKRNVGSKIGAIIFVITLILVNYWVFLKDNLTISSPAGEQTVQPPPTVEIPTGQTEESPIPIETPENTSSTTVAGELHSGETVLQALQTLGVKTEEALPLISAMEDVMDFRSARAGNSFRVEMDKVGKVVHFEYKQSSTEVYVVKRNDTGKLQASKKDIPTETKVAALGCTIQGSLFNSFKRCGGDGKLANLFMNLFAWDFNFFEQAREGDTIRMLIEKVYIDGKFMNYGRILAAEYEGQVVGKYSVFHFKDPEGIEGYYTLDGQALRKEFLKVPVDYAAMESTGGPKGTGFEPPSFPSGRPQRLSLSGSSQSPYLGCGVGHGYVRRTDQVRRSGGGNPARWRLRLPLHPDWRHRQGRVAGSPGLPEERPGNHQREGRQRRPVPAVCSAQRQTQRGSHAREFPWWASLSPASTWRFSRRPWPASWMN